MREKAKGMREGAGRSGKRTVVGMQNEIKNKTLKITLKQTVLF